MAKHPPAALQGFCFNAALAYHYLKGPVIDEDILI
jgi:hypothetical protein